MSGEKDLRIRNWVDEDGDPAGGYFVLYVHEGPGKGKRLEGNFQDGPLGRGKCRREPNGCFVEDLLEVCEARMKFYQSSRFKCGENAEALDHISDALMCIRSRTERREAEGVEGTLEGN